MKRAVCKMEVTVTVELPPSMLEHDLSEEEVKDAAMGAVTQFHEVEAPFRHIVKDKDGREIANSTAWLKVFAEVSDDVVIEESE